MVNVAVKMCFVCPVRKECEAYRKATGSGYGVWGGEYLQRGKS